MRAYIESDDPVWPNDDRHYRDLTIFLRRERPDPDSLRPLLGAYDGDQVNAQLLKRDKVAQCVLHSYMGRVFRGDPAVAALWDNIVFCGIHFSFEPVYGASHPGAGESLGEFFSDPEITACAESEAAFRNHLDAMMEKWRGRVTRKASSLFFGNLLRHIGPDVADVLYREWKGMDANERIDLLRRTAGMEELGRIGRQQAVNALLDDSMEVREAAFDLLADLSAPLGDLDASSRDEDVEKALPALLRWAAETKS
ncbi:MAG: hypothetical protein ACYTHK_06525 [Planctomycetota bacterium]|jgi:hypothetical protein